MLVGPGRGEGAKQSEAQSWQGQSGRTHHRLQDQPAPSPSLHRSIVPTNLLVDKTRQDPWQRRPHWPGAGLKLVRRVVLEAAADRTSIRPLLLFLLLLPQLLPTYVCHKAVQPEHCLVS